MQHEQHGSLAFVEIVDLGSVDLLPVTLEWVLVLEEPGGSLHDGNGSGSTQDCRTGFRRGPTRVNVSRTHGFCFFQHV
jgi:hypothetical protein